MPLNTHAFVFNPSASEFVQGMAASASTRAYVTNKKQTRARRLKQPATSAATFVPGTFDLGASAFVSTAPAGKEAAQGEPDAKKPVENGAIPPPSKVLQSKLLATLAVADPASTPPSQQPAPAEPEVFSGRFAGNLKLSRDLGKKYSQRVMKLLQHDQRYIEMEQNRPELKSQIEEFRCLLEQAAELDASKDMPARQESRHNRGGEQVDLVFRLYHEASGWDTAFFESAITSVQYGPAGHVIAAGAWDGRIHLV